MALSEFELRKIEKEVASFVERRRPPPHIRDEVDIAYRVKGQSVEIFEISPRLNHSGEKTELAVAKATYVRKHGTWNVYWQRADLKWHRYDPVPEVGSLSGFLDLVDKDEYGCFFG